MIVPLSSSLCHYSRFLQQEGLHSCTEDRLGTSESNLNVLAKSAAVVITIGLSIANCLQEETCTAPCNPIHTLLHYTMGSLRPVNLISMYAVKKGLSIANRLQEETCTGNKHHNLSYMHYCYTITYYKYITATHRLSTLYIA